LLRRSVRFMIGSIRLKALRYMPFNDGPQKGYSIESNYF
jgi:hypothetical protein